MFISIFIVLVLVLLSGTYAGLTLSLFSLRLTALETKIRLGDRRAKRVYKIRKKGNLLLCSLLLGNVACYTTMTLFLDNITPGVMAGLIATSLIFIFGEILPQAVFPRYALEIGSRLHWLVWATLILFYPVSRPIAWLLDKAIGKETPVLWSKEELGEIIRYHEDVGDGIIDEDEERIVLGALSFSETAVKDVMVPKEEVFHLESDTIIDTHILEQIRRKGYSRIPVFQSGTNKVTGILNAKSLIGLWTPGKRVSHLYSTNNLIEVKTYTKLDVLLNLLIQRRMQMAVVIDKSGRFVGLVTLEDIMEEILDVEIDDLI